MPFIYATPPADGNRSWGNWMRTLLADLKAFVDGLESAGSAPGQVRLLYSGTAWPARVVPAGTPEVVWDSALYPAAPPPPNAQTGDFWAQGF